MTYQQFLSVSNCGAVLSETWDISILFYYEIFTFLLLTDNVSQRADRYNWMPLLSARQPYSTCWSHVTAYDFIMWSMAASRWVESFSCTCRLVVGCWIDTGHRSRDQCWSLSGVKQDVISQHQCQQHQQRSTTLLQNFIIRYKSVQHNVLAESFNLKAISKWPNKVVIFSTPLQQDCFPRSKLLKIS